MSFFIRHLIIIPLFAAVGYSHGQTVIDQDRLRAFSNEIEKIVNETKTVGVSVALIHNYELIWAKGFGVTEVNGHDSVTSETLFQAASITKSFTALAVMKNVQVGKITLKGDVDKQLMSWHLPRNQFTDKEPITVEQLLSHTGGVANSRYSAPGYAIDSPLPTISQALNGEAPALNDPVSLIQMPGTGYSYSNCGYWILEALLEDVEKKDFKEVVSDEVLVPLGLHHSTFNYDLPNREFVSVATGHLERNQPIHQKYYVIRPLSSGGLWSTPSDLAKLLIEIQLSMRGQSNRILSVENAKLMVKPVRGQYGLGFQNEVRGTGVKFFGHGGFNLGYISSMFGSLEGGFGVVIMTNSNNGWKAVNKIYKITGRTFWGF